MAVQEDNRFQIPFFFMITALSFVVFAGALFVLERGWNKTFLTVAAISSVLAAVSLLIEWAWRVFGWEKDKSPNDFPA